MALGVLISVIKIVSESSVTLLQPDSISTETSTSIKNSVFATKKSARLKEAFVITAVTSNSSKETFLDAFVLIRSLQETKTSRSIVLLVDERHFPPEIEKQVVREGVIVKKVAPIENPFKPSGRNRKHFSKMNAWNVTEFKKIVLLDWDTLILQNIDDLFNIPDALLPAAVPDPVFPNVFNSGVMVIKPSVQDFKLLLQASRSGKMDSYNGGDQGFLNSYYKQRWHSLDIRYNFQRGYLDDVRWGRLDSPARMRQEKLLVSGLRSRSAVDINCKVLKICSREGLKKYYVKHFDDIKILHWTRGRRFRLQDRTTDKTADCRGPAAWFQFCARIPYLPRLFSSSQKPSSPCKEALHLMGGFCPRSANASSQGRSPRTNESAAFGNTNRTAAAITTNGVASRNASPNGGRKKDSGTVAAGTNRTALSRRTNGTATFPMTKPSGQAGPPHPPVRAVPAADASSPPTLNVSTDPGPHPVLTPQLESAARNASNLSPRAGVSSLASRAGGPKRTNTSAGSLKPPGQTGPKYKQTITVESEPATARNQSAAGPGAGWGSTAPVKSVIRVSLQPRQRAKQAATGRNSTNRIAAPSTGPKVAWKGSRTNGTAKANSTGSAPPSGPHPQAVVGPSEPPANVGMATHGRTTRTHLGEARSEGSGVTQLTPPRQARAGAEFGVGVGVGVGVATRWDGGERAGSRSGARAKDGG